jgi:hypothetical protein
MVRKTEDQVRIYSRRVAELGVLLRPYRGRGVLLLARSLPLRRRFLCVLQDLLDVRHRAVVAPEAVTAC